MSGQTLQSLMRKRMVDGGITALYTVRWDSNVFKKACTDWLATLMQISMGKYTESNRGWSLCAIESTA